MEIEIGNIDSEKISLEITEKPVEYGSIRNEGIYWNHFFSFYMLINE
jgi:hypothetical protein